MIVRDVEPRLRRLAKQFPAIVLTGPRQSGKSTLCQKVFARLPYATLESPDVRAFALEDPRGFLRQFPNGAVLDEIQNGPKLPSYLQEFIDRDPAPGRWILTGSQIQTNEPCLKIWKPRRVPAAKLPAGKRRSSSC